MVLALFGAGLAFLIYSDTQTKARREAALREQAQAASMLRAQGLEDEAAALERDLKQENDKNVTKLRQQYEREVRELQSKYELKMKLLREDLELRRKVEILEIEERKNNHINELMKKHEKAFGEIKNYCAHLSNISNCHFHNSRRGSSGMYEYAHFRQRHHAQ